MYLPSHFKEDRLPVLHQLVRAHPLATLVTLGADGLVANHIPMEIEPGGALGVLRGHVSRSNPVWETARLDVEALAIFQGRRATSPRRGTAPSRKAARWSPPGTTPWSMPTGRCG